MLARPRRRLLLLALPLLLGLGGRPAGADEWSDAKKAFRKAQRSESVQERRDAYLRMLDFDDGDAVEEVLRAMGREENPAVLMTGMESLALFQSPEAVAALLEEVRRAKGTERLCLIVSLGQRTDRAGSDVLLELLSDRDEMVVSQAAWSLGRLGVQQALPALLELLGKDAWQVRSAAARAVVALAGPIPEDPPPGKPPKPWVTEGLDVQAALAALARALPSCEGRDRGDVIEALERITGKAFGNDPLAWQMLADGSPLDQIHPTPDHPPYVFGIPIYGRKVVILVDISTCTDDVHPFQDVDRLKAVCEVPGARNVPWYELRTTKQFIAAHAKRLVQDLPTPGSKFDVIAVFQKAEGVFGKLTPANAGTKRRAIEFLDELSVQNGPNHYSGFMAALDLGGTKDSIAWSQGPDEIVLATCAIPWAPKDPNAIVDQDELARIVGLKARLRMVPIHTVGVGPHPASMMKLISGLTAGRYVNLER